MHSNCSQVLNIATQSITPSFDAGYSFKYCLGAIVENGRKSPFGCSTKKAKVWITWVRTLDEFKDECEKIEAPKPQTMYQTLCHRKRSLFASRRRMSMAVQVKKMFAKSLPR